MEPIQLRKAKGLTWNKPEGFASGRVNLTLTLTLTGITILYNPNPNFKPILKDLKAAASLGHLEKLKKLIFAGQTFAANHDEPLTLT